MTPFLSNLCLFAQVIGKFALLTGIGPGIVVMVMSPAERGH